LPGATHTCPEMSRFGMFTHFAMSSLPKTCDCVAPGRPNQSVERPAAGLVFYT
jgi:hypothetical protein